MDNILDYANNVNNINFNKYFINLQNIPPINNFLKSQECFISAVDNWSRVFGLLLYYLPTDHHRSIIIKNLYDEHGEGDINKSHVNTFKLLLLSLNYNEEILLYNETLPSYKYIKIFNEKLKDVINTKNWIYSVAMLGMIEYTYITVSKNIHNYLCNYLTADDINHYSLHEILDVSHSTELFSLLPELTDESKDGLNYGYNLMNELYINLTEFL